jgi:hypothetical protein
MANSMNLDIEYRRNQQEIGGFPGVPMTRHTAICLYHISMLTVFQILV